MTLKDLLAHYMGMNEGIINMLEHYFDMSRKDAERSLELYKRFCWQTEKVVAFLNSSKRLSYSLRSAVPSLKHAPLSLAGALEEYLDDPNFEENRSEYLRNKGGKDAKPDVLSRAKGESSKPAPKDEPKGKEKEEKEKKEKEKEKEKDAAPKSGNESSQQALQDFFEALEQPSATPFQAAYSSFAGFNAQPDWFNAPMPTGPYGMVAQPTGFNPFAPMPTGAPMMPQMTGFNPFQQQQMQPMFTGAQQPLAPQHTMATTPFESIFGQMSLGGGQPTPQGQAKSAGPAAQDGTSPWGAGSMGPQPTGQQQQPFGQQQQQQQPFGQPQQQQPFGQQQQQQQPFGQPPQPARQPFGQPTQSANSAPPKPDTSNTKVSFAQPSQTMPPGSSAPRMKPQKTGSMNPFSIPSDFEEPVPVVEQPKQPSLNQLAHQNWFGNKAPVHEPESIQPEPSAPKPNVPQATGLMGSVASEFARPQDASSPAQLPRSQTMGHLDAQATGCLLYTSDAADE